MEFLAWPDMNSYLDGSEGSIKPDLTHANEPGYVFTQLLGWVKEMPQYSDNSHRSILDDVSRQGHEILAANGVIEHEETHEEIVQRITRRIANDIVTQQNRGLGESLFDKQVNSETEFSKQVAAERAKRNGS